MRIREIKINDYNDVDKLMVWSFNEKALIFYEELGMKTQRYIFEKEL